MPKTILANESAAILDFFLRMYSNSGTSVLVLGHSGVGKSLVSKWVLQNLPRERYVNKMIHITPETTSSSLQSSMMTGLDRLIL